MQNAEARDAGERQHQPAVVTLAECGDPPGAADAPQGEDLAGRRFDVAGVRRRLHDADQAVAGERVVDKHEIARLEHIQRERGARQENGAAQRK